MTLPFAAILPTNGVMQKINLKDVPPDEFTSPKGKYACTGYGLSLALGRDDKSTDLRKRHPFDVELNRLPPGKSMCPYHSHSAQWEFYHVVSGTGRVRHADGHTPIEPGDAFLFEPGQPHQIFCDGPEDLVFYVIADNPVGESCHYPDSGKWVVRSPERRLIRSEPLDYFDGEE